LIAQCQDAPRTLLPFSGQHGLGTMGRILPLRQLLWLLRRLPLRAGRVDDDKPRSRRPTSAMRAQQQTQGGQEGWRDKLAVMPLPAPGLNGAEA
jgi:hypothetical protein